ncbi:IS256 family transposase [Komagataeibacter nataicola]|uniref:Mutator family transposase n=1 Tax=Komagataeibacter nataicola TaxID=265960 RepID=A0ABX5PA74_9PROT|nr:IS256 family transposase [Komagataeibacter nataicola]PYD66158.1 IS256 family transposase [Komagataeibacter nataicola]WNM07564.1 IS256 family transposase [Komagataeibacter nataicola]GBR25593.1 transposase [Komagataeibacter nataicola NRIC 0616]
MAIDKDVLDQLLAGRDPRELFASGGLLDELKKALSERRNRRNGTSKKTVLTGSSQVTLDIPRDRAGTFDPKLIAKYQRRFPDFDDKIISMYARGMSVREIRGHLEDLYGIEVSPDLISTVTDAVMDAVTEWQGWPLDTCYPLVFFDAIRVKIRDEGFVRNKAIYMAPGILPDGTKDIPGLWIEQTEGAKFWLRVMNELKHRGVGDILITVVDGLKGFPEAIAPCWRRVWDNVVPFFACPEAVRKIIYTTNSIEAMNSKLRRAVRARGHFPNDEAAMKLLYLVLNHLAQDWKRPPREWTEAKTQFAIIFGERFTL